MRLPRNWPAYVGMATVAVAAAWMSFSALAGLARLAHIWPPVLLPVAIDAYAVTSTGVWLQVATTERARRWAKFNSFAAIAVSVVGNSAYHGLTSAGVTRPSWLITVAVAAVPPAALYLTVHLWSLVSADARTADPASPVPAAVAKVPRDPAPSRGAAHPPTSRPRPAGRPAVSKTEQMREFARVEIAAGREVTGGQLARQVGGDPSAARRVLRELATVSSNGHGHA